MKKEMVKYPLSIESDMMKRIKQLAEKNDRTLIGQIRRLLKWALKNGEKENGTRI